LTFGDQVLALGLELASTTIDVLSTLLQAADV